MNPLQNLFTCLIHPNVILAATFTHSGPITTDDLILKYGNVKKAINYLELRSWY